MIESKDGDLMLFNPPFSGLSSISMPRLLAIELFLGEEPPALDFPPPPFLGFNELMMEGFPLLIDFNLSLDTAVSSRVSLLRLGMVNGSSRPGPTRL